MLIPESLLKVDEEVEDIIVRGDDLSSYYADIDLTIKADAFDVGVKPEDIPVDENGYVTSMRLQKLGQNYGLYKINFGYNRIGSGEADDVYASWKTYYSLYQEQKALLTEESITGGSETDEPSIGNNIRQSYVII